MAETPTGVTSTGTGRRQRGGRGASGFFRRNKTAVLGGGAVLAFLVMGHKGGQSGSGTSQATQQDALNQEQQAIAQEQAALESGNLIPGGYDTGLSSGGAGGGAGSAGAGAGGSLVGDPGTADGSAGTAGAPAGDPTSNQGAGQIGPINVTVNNPRPKGQGKRKPPGRAKPTGTGVRKRGAPAPKPKVAPKGKPAPAAKHPSSHPQASHPHAPQSHHPATPKRTPHGGKKRSPAEVEAVGGFGAGVVVMGREFPGALAHRMGAPRLDPADGICRTVTLDYGGRSETHMVHGDGRRWTDNVRGMNPPSRGVPMAAGRDDSI